MRWAVCVKMGKWPYELADVPVDNYLFIANGINAEAEQVQRQIDEAKKRYE